MREIDFPSKAIGLFKPSPYKVMHGGRGGSKTWNFCRALLILGSRVPLFILCTREFQKSIRESVHRTLTTQLEPLGLDSFYTVEQSRIYGKEIRNKFTGQVGRTQFVFEGLRNNIAGIKSMEGIDICAVFEATTVTGHSWDVLLPTIRRDAPHGPFGQGSEIWVEFNPELAQDATYRRWVSNPPPKTEVMEINWRDNPWFPKFLKDQKDQMEKEDYDNFLTVWEGQVRKVVRGAIYAKELENAIRQNRLNNRVLYDHSRAVDVAADLGRADTCALWFVQQSGMEHHVIDYYSGFGFDWSHYLAEIQHRKYRVGKFYLPHDAAAEQLAARKSIAAQTRDAYPNDGQVIVVPRTPSVVNDINAVRLLFPRLWFNSERCADGIQAISHYRYEIDEETKEVAPKPLHDWASHGADALRCYVMGLRIGDRYSREQKYMPSPAPAQGSIPRGQGWMSV